MALSRQKKEEILEKLRGILKDAESVVFVNFHGLGVDATGEIRKALREKGVGYFVSRKTLVKKALEGEKVSGEVPSLDGELAIVYGEDSIAPAREVYSFMGKYKDKLSILGGIFEERFLPKEEMLEIATIPSLETLRGMFVNVINSPIQGLVVSLGQIAEKKS